MIEQGLMPKIKKGNPDSKNKIEKKFFLLSNAIKCSNGQLYESAVNTYKPPRLYLRHYFPFISYPKSII